MEVEHGVFIPSLELSCKKIIREFRTRSASAIRLAVRVDYRGSSACMRRLSTVKTIWLVSKTATGRHVPARQRAAELRGRLQSTGGQDLGHYRNQKVKIVHRKVPRDAWQTGRLEKKNAAPRGERRIFIGHALA